MRKLFVLLAAMSLYGPALAQGKAPKSPIPPGQMKCVSACSQPVEKCMKSCPQGDSDCMEGCSGQMMKCVQKCGPLPDDPGGDEYDQLEEDAE